MIYLRIKKGKRRRKSDGRPWAHALAICKSRKFGPVLEEKHISVRRPLLITGPHASGKTRWMDRLSKDAGLIWSSIRAKPLILSATRPLSAWTDVPHLEAWWDRRKGVDRPWAKLRAWERVDALPLYLEETKAVLMVDDAHLLAGRKLKVVQDCVRSAKIWCMAATEESRIGPGLRRDVLAADPQIVRLDSDVAYDATTVVIWIMIAVAVGLGYWELAAALGGLKLLGRGQRAAKQS